jgi:anti-anti-sigma factor
MELLTITDKSAIVANLAGRMDAESAPEIGKEMLQALLPGTRYMILCFSELEYISSAGLRSVLTVARRIQGMGGELICAGLRGSALAVFKAAGFYGMFQEYESVEEALNNL